MKNKGLLIIVIALFAFLQYELWFSPTGMRSNSELKHQVAAAQAQNQRLSQRNKQLLADINDLKRAKQAVEERARHNMGMVKRGEVFYQVTRDAR